jgi:hypothetical protein
MTDRLNRLLEWLWASGFASEPSLRPSDIVAKAEAASCAPGQWLRAAWRRRLELLSADLAEHAELTPLGRTIAHGQLVAAASNMLRFEKLWRRHPEIHKVGFSAPILIVGQMRSGTTRMQRLLACDERFRFTRFYESWNPVPRFAGNLFDDRPARAWAALAAARWINPEFGTIHPTSARAPDEEIGLFNILMHSAAYEAQWQVPRFVAHCEAMDAAPLYRDFERMMKTLAWLRNTNDDRPWILKVPQFAQDLDAILSVFPDARVVLTKRPLPAVLSSSVRLVANQRSVQTASMDIPAIAREWWRKIELRERRTADALEEHRPKAVEVAFDDMDSDWEREMMRVYRMLGLRFTPDLRARMLGYLERGSAGAPGAAPRPSRPRPDFSPLAGQEYAASLPGRTGAFARGERPAYRKGGQSMKPSAFIPAMASLGAATAVFLWLSACSQPAPTLPAGQIEAAATCFAAKLAQIPGTTMSASETDAAAHFLFLGAVKDGLASPTALQQATELGNSLQDKIVEGGDPAGYNGPCEKRFPQTKAGTFKGLPDDSRDTRMMCLTLSTSLLQTYRSAGATPLPDTVAMNARLDSSLMAEFNAEANLNPAEFAGVAMRAMAKAAELGPVGDVNKACSERYGRG